MNYGLFSTNTDSDKIIQYYYHTIVGPYWDANESIWTKTMKQYHSLVRKSKQKNNQIPIDLIHDDLKISWQKGDRKVIFPFLLRIGKIK